MAVAAERMTPPHALSEQVREYALQFVCEERYSLPEVLEVVHEAYQMCDSSTDLPPSFGKIAEELFWWYQVELMERALIKMDIDLGGNPLHEDIVAAIEAGVCADVGDYIQYLEEGGQWVSTHNDDGSGKPHIWGERFLNDIEYLLNISNLVYAQVDYEEPEDYDGFSPGMKRLPAIGLRMYNSPILEVW